MKKEGINMGKSLKKMKKNKVIMIAAISSIAAGIIIILIGMSFYNYRISKLDLTDITNHRKYKYHYAIISEESDAPFWEAIYQGALQKGNEMDIYVEKIGSKLSVSYSLYDLLQIAIASKVDGIIIEPNGEDSIAELINAAEKEGTVITVLKDLPNSNRKSYVGINSYNQGQAYGRQVLEVVEEGKQNITVLLNSDVKDSSQNIIYSSIREILHNKNVRIEAATVNTQSTFSSEEDIRNIIMDTVDPPDVLVCLTAVDTLCAYQAVVDYNKVGQIDIIGYYDSDIILRAIEKNIIHSTMTLDARQMGAYCVEAIAEFRETKRVSDYFSVDISIINKDNVKEYMDARSKVDLN